MLTDESINIAKNLLSKQFPNLNGLEKSTLRTDALPNRG